MQIADRAALRPVLSGEQERLCALNMDGKPRLVRGVAGSGKTYVLAHWLARTVGAPDFRGKAWVLYANQSLRGLLERTAADAWTTLFPTSGFPTDRVEFIHVGQLLTDLCIASGLGIPYDMRYEYDAIAASYLDSVPAATLAPRCDALFVDEGQDFGERTLELCFALVRGTADAPGQKPAMVFYDNAQDVYGRGTPTWSHLGLNIIGRSTVMKESFRSTRPICEFALNVALRLSNHVEDGELKELTQRRLVVKAAREGAVWWNVEFNHVDGPQPVFKRFPDRDAEMAAMALQVRRWVVDEGVRCSDIKVLVNGQSVRSRAVAALTSVLVRDGVHVSEQHAQAFQEDDRTIIVSTAHSFKGHEAEIVVVPAADKYTGSGEVLKSALYVAMTRARSLLYVSCLELRGTKPGRAIFDALLETDQLARGQRPPDLGALVGEDALAEVTRSLDSAGRAWVKSLASRFPISLEPIFAGDGSILAQPTFSFESDGTPYAFFANGVSAATADDLDDAGIGVLEVGDEPIGLVP